MTHLGTVVLLVGFVVLCILGFIVAGGCVGAMPLLLIILVAGGFASVALGIVGSAGWCLFREKRGEYPTAHDYQRVNWLICRCGFITTLACIAVAWAAGVNLME